MQRMVKYSFATNGSGIASISVQVPGTFNGLTRNLTSPNGRQVYWIKLECGSPVAGDYAYGFQLVDSSGVASAYSSQFPSYPTIMSFADPQVANGNVGIYLSAFGPTTIYPPNVNNFAPSQLWITGNVQKNVGLLGANSSDTVYVSIFWDDLT